MLPTNAAYQEPAYNPVAGWDGYPTDEKGWRDLYDFRWSAYKLDPYSAATQQREHLFRAFDDSGNEIDQTRRVYAYAAFVANVDARALHGGKLILETEAGATDTLQAMAEAVWRRSRFAASFPRWARMLCVLGDYWVEPVRMSNVVPYRTRLVGYDPRCITATYDAATGTELEKVEINCDYHEAGTGLVKRYRRVLTRDAVEVYRDSKRVDAESKPHGLGGVVPIVHMACIPCDNPSHSLSASFGIERALMHLDGMATQGKAISTRFANPTLALYGFRVGVNSDVQKFGRMIDGAPADGRAEYLEIGGEALARLGEQMRDLQSHIREVTPEFLFASDSAQESADSRSLRGQAFEAKMLEMRAGVYDALARVTGMAVAMDADSAYDADVPGVVIDAPPVLPRNAKAEIETLALVETKLKRADYTRHLQRLDIVPAEVDPEEYAREVDDEQAMRATAFFTDPLAVPPVVVPPTVAP